jgi:outer membrane protein assembly factor BamB
MSRGLFSSLFLYLTLVACKPGRSTSDRPSAFLRLAGLRRDGGVLSRPRTMDQPPTPHAPTAFRMDRGHTGRSGWHLPRRPRILGRVRTRGRISAQPIGMGDGGVAVGSHDGLFYTATRAGAVRWRFNSGDRVYTTPVVTDDGTVFFGSDADRFLALSARGRLQVALATEDDADTSPTLAADGSLRFAAGHTLFAVEHDLTVRWRVDVGGKIFSSPCLTEDGTAVFGSQDNHIYAVDASGQQLWRVETRDDVDAPPMMDAQGNIYVGSDDGSVYALARDGSERWRRALGGFIRAGAALGLDGTILVGTYGPRTRLVALDRNTGRELWTYSIAGPPTREYGIASAPLVDADGRIAFGAPDDALHMVERDGTHAQRFPLPADVDSAPVLIDDHLLAVGCDDGVLYLIGE